MFIVHRLLLFALGIEVEIPQPDLRRSEELQRIARPFGERPNIKYRVGDRS